MTMRPLSGRSSPASAGSVVVLAQPDGPSRVTNSPGAAVRLTSCSAVTSPNVLLMRSIVMASMLSPRSFQLHETVDAPNLPGRIDGSEDKQRLHHRESRQCLAR